MGLWYPKGSGFDLTAFSDADHAGCLDTRKSTSGGIQFLGDKLVSWMSKKQECTTMPSAEAEYVASSASCAQVENGYKIELYFVRTEYQLADMFTKALPEDRFQYLVRQIGMRCLTPAELEVLTKEILLDTSSNINMKMPTKIELTLEQSQQGVSNDVLDPKDGDVYQGRLLASFQDDAKYEHVGQDTRSQGGKDDQDKQGKDLKISDIKTKSKDNDKGSRSKITKHEGTSLQRRQRQRSQELNDKSNLIDLMKECHNELTSGEIVSLKIMSRTMEVRS
ncbi:hypothetical protein Tco_0844121 [Tanacetum coccineum]